MEILHLLALAQPCQSWGRTVHSPVFCSTGLCFLVVCVFFWFLFQRAKLSSAAHQSWVCYSWRCSRHSGCNTLHLMFGWQRPGVKALNPALRTANACWHKWVLRVLSSTEPKLPLPEANFKQLHFIPTYVPSLEFGYKLLLLFHKSYFKREASLLLIYFISMSAVFTGASANHSHKWFQMISGYFIVIFSGEPGT